MKYLLIIIFLYVGCTQSPIKEPPLTKFDHEAYFHKFDPAKKGK